MNKSKVISLIFILTLSIFAKSHIGIGFNIHSINEDVESPMNILFDTDITITNPNGSAKMTNTNLFFDLKYGIMVTDIIEIMPYVQYNFQRSKYDVTGHGKSKSKFHGFGFGEATNFHIYRGNIFHVSTGIDLNLTFYTKHTLKTSPKIPYKSFQYPKIAFGTRIPLNIDMHINKVVMFRLSSYPLDFKLIKSGLKIKFESSINTTNETVSDGITTMITSDFIPKFSLLFKF